MKNIILSIPLVLIICSILIGVLQGVLNAHDMVQGMILIGCTLAVGFMWYGGSKGEEK